MRGSQSVHTHGRIKADVYACEFPQLVVINTYLILYDHILLLSL